MWKFDITFIPPCLLSVSLIQFNLFVFCFCILCLVSGSLGGVADLKLFSFQSELSKTRHDGLITSCKMKSSTLESFCGLRGVRMVHRPVHAAGFNRQPWRLTNSLAVSCSSDGSMSFSWYNMLLFYYYYFFQGKCFYVLLFYESQCRSNMQLDQWNLCRRVFFLKKNKIM